MQKIAEKVYEIDAGHCLDDLDVDQIRDLILSRIYLSCATTSQQSFSSSLKFIYLV